MNEVWGLVGLLAGDPWACLSFVTTPCDLPIKLLLTISENSNKKTQKRSQTNSQDIGNE